jgi:hypothetical protein
VLYVIACLWDGVKLMNVSVGAMVIVLRGKCGQKIKKIENWVVHGCIKKCVASSTKRGTNWNVRNSAI